MFKDYRLTSHDLIESFGTPVICCSINPEEGRTGPKRVGMSLASLIKDYQITLSASNPSFFISL